MAVNEVINWVAEDGTITPINLEHLRIENGQWVLCKPLAPNPTPAATVSVKVSKR